MLGDFINNDLLRGLLLEAYRQQNIIQAMKNRWVCRILYDGEDLYGGERTGDNGKGWRIIEMFAFGVTKHGHEAIRAWQRRGSSQTPQGDGFDPLKKIEGWRLFRVDRIKKIEFLKHQTPFEPNRPNYNDHDKDMSTIYYAVPRGKVGATPEAPAGEVDTRVTPERKTDRRQGHVRDAQGNLVPRDKQAPAQPANKSWRKPTKSMDGFDSHQ